jgi:selenocysteine lyase/cysteine desulfurase
VPAIRIIGVADSLLSKRVATLSMTHNTLDSKTIVEQVDQFNIGIRFGDFYAVELINNLGLRNIQGVVRISLAHYNTTEEVDALILALQKFL